MLELQDLLALCNSYCQTNCTIVLWHAVWYGADMTIMLVKLVEGARPGKTNIVLVLKYKCRPQNKIVVNCILFVFTPFNSIEMV